MRKVVADINGMMRSKDSWKRQTSTRNEGDTDDELIKGQTTCFRSRSGSHLATNKMATGLESNCLIRMLKAKRAQLEQ